MTQVRRSHLPFVWLLLAAALLLRAAVPAGWMPTAGQDGVRIALCTGIGEQFLTLGSDGKFHNDAPKPVAPHDPCPFGLATGMAANATPEVHLPLPLASLATLNFPELPEIALTQRKYPRPPATGPPALA